MTVTSRRPEMAATRRDRQAGRARLINETLFRGALVRERRRADRSNTPLMLVLVALKESPAAAPPDATGFWFPVVEAMSAITRETDILGWFRHGSAVGAIVPEVQPWHPGRASEFATTLHAELVRRLDPAVLEQLAIHLHVHPEPQGLAAEAIGAIDPLIGSTEPGRPIYEGTKRALDVVGSLAGLILLSPLFLLIAVLVKWNTPGPVFFRQTRVGRMRKTFTCFKFRTMHANADHAIHQKFVSSFIKSDAQAQEAGRTGMFKITDDPRVTAVGRVLRKTSLDELPQLLNVLRGDMSLVGPRPPVPYEVEQYQPWHCRRVLETKPGLTGLWQVNGRSRTTFDDMVRLDLRYAKSRSLWTDVKILLATPKAVIDGKGAC